MKKVFLTLAVVFATSTVLVSCGGKKDASVNTTAEATGTEEVAPEAPVTTENAATENADEKKDEKKGGK